MHKDMELWNKVRHAVLVEKISQREATRRFRMSPHTVRKMLDNAQPPEFQNPEKTAKYAAFVPVIQGFLDEEKTLPRKQHYTAKRIFERLRDEHDFPGSERQVRRMVAKLRKKQGKKLFVPLAHRPGEAQFDFGFAEVILAGVQQQIAYAVGSLPRSNVRYVQAFPRECTETFQEALRRFFRFLGGVPTLIKFDNSKVNTAKIFCQRGKKPSQGLLQLTSHYLFEPHFCRVRQPQEKGHVENAVDYVRSNFMVPLPVFADFEELNAYLEEKCREELSKTSARQTKTIGALFNEEKPSLLPLPEEDFDARRVEHRCANSLSLVRFDRNDYSVPSQHAHKPFAVFGTIDSVQLYVDNVLAATHRRDWGMNHTHYHPLHYLHIAQTRPNALDFGEPFADWQLPACFEVLRRRLEAKAGRQGKREYIRILQLLERFTLEEVASAIEASTPAYDAIRLRLECQKEVSAELFSLDDRPYLQQVLLPEPSLNVYVTLMETMTYEKTRDEIDGVVETSSQTVETFDDRTRVRRDGVAVCEGKCRPPGLPAATGGAGAAGAGGAFDGASVEVGTFSQHENAGNV